MEHILSLEMRKRILQNKKRKRRIRLVTILASVVVFCTTYALILPAITLQGETWCGHEAHAHGEECYVNKLICEKSEEGHQHTEGCKKTESVLICEKSEEGHLHTEECIRVEEQLICSTEEQAAHSHDDNCYYMETELSCTLVEDEAHTHEDSCYTIEKTVICDKEETEGHSHIDNCYTEHEKYICGHEEVEIHTHGEECYEINSALVCGQEEAEVHTHEDSCYEEHLACDKEEHEHKTICYSNPIADIETSEIWERNLPKELSGVWADDVVSVAESQLGYKESAENYTVTEDDKRKGYTRYGAWYGDAYGDWCAMFVSFCLNYSDIPEEMMEREANCIKWIEKLEKENQYQKAEEYMPKKGDIIFFDMGNSTKGADHVGVVAECKEEQNLIKTIEGNSSDKVQYCTYDMDSEKIIGYGILPENPARELEDVKSSTEEAVNADTVQKQPLMMRAVLSTLTEDFTDYITKASVGKVTVTDREYYTNLTLGFKIAAEDVTGKEFVYQLPAGVKFKTGLGGTIQTVRVNGLTAYTCEFMEDTDGTQKLKLVFDESYVSTVSGSMTSSFEFSVRLSPENADDSGKLTLQMSDDVVLDVMLYNETSGKASTIPEGKYGNYYFEYNNIKNAFTSEPEYSKYYNADSPLGVAGSFHIVAFDTATLSTHTNGNILAHTLRANSNFGTNNYQEELTYAVHYQKLNSTSASSNDHILVIGSENAVTLGGNNDNIYINEVKIDKPYNIIQDSDSGKKPFIDLTAVNIEVAGISSRLEKSVDGGITTSFSDQNNRSIKLDNPNSVGYYTIKASELNNYANNPISMQGFTKGGDGTIIINVDCTGVKTINMPAATIWIDGKEQSTAEVTEFSNGKVVWNFINATGATINTNRMTGMVIALGATVNIKQNLNGTVIAEFVNVQAESHRTDFTGQIEVLPDEGDNKVNIGVRKVNSQNISIYLEGAEFALYKWNGNTYEMIAEGLETDANGLLRIKDLTYNTAYRLVETKAPSGYILGEKPYDFYVPNSNTSKYPYKRPHNYTGIAHSSSNIRNIKNDKDEQEKIKITVKKEWYIENQRITSIDGLVNIDVYQQVYKDAEYREKVMDDILYANALEIDSHQGWEIILDNLPSKGSKTIDGTQQTVYYKYYVEEEPVRGYTPSYENNDGITNGTIIIKNTSDGKKEFTELALEKEWFDFEGNAMEAPKDAEVTVQLYQTGYEGALFHHQLTEKTLYKEIVLNAANGWKQAITDLPEYEVIETTNGKQTVYYQYTAEEVSVRGYTDTYENNDTYEGTILIKNTVKHHPRAIVIEKSWKDSEGNALSKDGEIVIDLYQKIYVYKASDTDFSEFKGAKLYKENIRISADEGWRKRIDNLPLHGWMKINGQEVEVLYSYYVQEEQVDGFKTIYENNEGITGVGEDEADTDASTIKITNVELNEYSLPETGGRGTNLFILGGSFMIAISLLGYFLKFRRKEVF